MRVSFEINVESPDEVLAARGKMLEALIELNESILRRMRKGGQQPAVETLDIRIDDEEAVGAIGDALTVLRTGRGTIEAVSALRVAAIRLVGKKARVRYEAFVRTNGGTVFVTTKVILDGNVVDPWLEGLREDLRKRLACAPLDQPIRSG